MFLALETAAFRSGEAPIDTRKKRERLYFRRHEAGCQHQTEANAGAGIAALPHAGALQPSLQLSRGHSLADAEIQTTRFAQAGLRDTREMFDSTAQLAVRCIAKVADAAQPYDHRIFRFVNDAAVSKDEVDLMYVRRRWYIVCVCEIDDPELIEPTDVPGVDFGVVIAAAQSQRSAAIAPKAAKRCPRQLSGQQRKFRTYGNGLQDLTLIRNRAKACRDRRGGFYKLSFGWLGPFAV
jgi:hypothetical protein